jgi:hypothetical protein
MCKRLHRNPLEGFEKTLKQGHLMNTEAPKHAPDRRATRSARSAAGNLDDFALSTPGRIVDKIGRAMN